MSVMEIILLLAIAIGLLGIWLLTRTPRDVVYLDTARAKILSSDTFLVRAKPDKLQRVNEDRIHLTEYKHRGNRIFQSDRVQMIVTALAARESGFNVRSGTLETSSGNVFSVDLSADSDVLYSRIESTLTEARKANAGMEPIAKPSSTKCRSCAYSSVCPYSQA